MTVGQPGSSRAIAVVGYGVVVGQLGTVVSSSIFVNIGDPQNKCSAAVAVGGRAVAGQMCVVVGIITVVNRCEYLDNCRAVVVMLCRAVTQWQSSCNTVAVLICRAVAPKLCPVLDSWYHVEGWWCGHC